MSLAMDVFHSPESEDQYAETHRKGIHGWRGSEHELGVADTIYEDCEEAIHHSNSSTEKNTNFGVCCNLAFPRDSAWMLLQRSPHPSTTQEVLQRSVWSWCEATGFPASVTVNVRGRTFKLHKFPLVSKSGFFKRQLMEGNEVELPESFPGGAAIFEVLAAYCYGATIVMNPSNIAALRCASEFFEMTEEYCRGNLCKRSELYFNEAVLNSWEDCIEVLRTCKNLHRLAEEMLIVSSCVESISVMAVMNRFERKYQLNEGNSVDSCEDWWMNDLLTLPFDYFGQFIACVRRRGMQENIIGRTMLLYVDRWIFDMLRASEGSAKSLDSQVSQALSRAERRGVIELIVRLLPVEKDAMPVSFLFAILRCALAWNASLECRLQLEKRIAAQLEQATVTDFLLPLKTEEDQILASRTEIESMQKIVSHFISQQTQVGNEYSRDCLFSEGMMNSCESSCCINPRVSAVARVWDEYLAEIAFDPSLAPPAFMNLIDTVPSSSRASHDRLYKAIHIYFKTHAQMSEQQKQNMCKTLNCQKLSKEACIHAVQNDLLPLRVIVQAMFMHQLQATSSSNENSIVRVHEDTKYASVRKNGKGSSSLGNILKRDEAFLQANHLKADFDETRTRLGNLEEEIARMRISFQASLRKNNLESDASIAVSKQAMDIPQIIAEESSPTDLYAKQPPEFSTKGCGSGVTHKFVKSLQKLNLKKAKQTANCVHVDEEQFHSEAKKMKHRSRPQTRNVAESRSFDIPVDKLKSGDSKEINAIRRRHRRNLSAS